MATVGTQGLDEIVMVPVPRRHLGAVYDALSAAMGTGTSPDSPVVSQPQPQPGVMSRIFGSRSTNSADSFWTPERVRLLHSRLTYPGARMVITMAASRAPREVTLAEVEAATGTSIKQIRAELGAMVKLGKKLFGDNVGVITENWPISVRYGEGGVSNYGMREDIAKLWLDLPEQPSV